MGGSLDRVEISIFLLALIHACDGYENKNYVYKYFSYKMPSGYICPKQEVPLTRLDVPGFHCIVGDSREDVFIIDPDKFKLKWYPKKEAYSVLGGSITFMLELNGKQHQYIWIKIIYAKDYFYPRPRISGPSISWGRGIGGRFKFYIISPFKAIGFTLKINREVDWKPDSEINIDSPSNGAGTSFWNNIGQMLDVINCKLQKNRVTVVRNLLLYHISGMEAKDILQCRIRLSQFTTVTWTTDLIIKKLSLVGYFPPIDRLYIAATSKFPITFDVVLDPVRCGTNGTPFIVENHPLLKGIPGRYKITCPLCEMIGYDPLIFATDTFDLKWKSVQSPYVVSLGDSNLTMNDISTYKCWWVSIKTSGEIRLDKPFTAGKEDFAVQCVAFGGRVSLHGRLFHPRYLSERIIITLFNSRTYYLIGEHIEDILVQAWEGITEISSKSIRCTGQIPFHSPYIRISNHKIEGEFTMKCYAVHMGTEGRLHEFRLYFMAQPYFGLQEIKVGNLFIALTSYKKHSDANFSTYRPSQLSPQICSVHCINIDNRKPSFINTVELNTLRDEFEVFDCFCNRTYTLLESMRRVSFLFPLKRGVLVKSEKEDSTRTCLSELRNEISVGRADEKKSLPIPIVKYQKVTGDCPDLTCTLISQALQANTIIKWTNKSLAVEMALIRSYKEKVSIIDCYGYAVQVYNYHTLRPPPIVHPPETSVIPELLYELLVMLPDTNKHNTLAYRCQFPEIINPFMQHGHAVMRSYYTEPFVSKLYCKPTRYEDPVIIQTDFNIIPLKSLTTTISPVMGNTWRVAETEFTCTTNKPKLLSYYGTLTMAIFITQIIHAKSETNTIRLPFGAGGGRPQTYSVRCYINVDGFWGELKRMEFLSYEAFVPSLKLRSVDSNVYVVGGTPAINSRVDFEEEEIRENRAFSVAEAVGNDKITTKVLYDGKLIETREWNVKVIDVSKFTLGFRPENVNIALNTTEDSQIIECFTKNMSNDTASLMQTAWQLSDISMTDHPPICIGPEAIINASVSEGTFCLSCSIPVLRDASPHLRECFTVIHFHRVGIQLTPVESGGIYVKGQESWIDCRITADPEYIERVKSKIVCSVLPLDSYLEVDKTKRIRLSPEVSLGPFRVRASMSIGSSEVSSIEQLGWVIDPSELILTFPNQEACYAETWKGNITCSLGNKNLTDYRRAGFRWIYTDTGNIVPHSAFNVLFISSVAEINRQYTCQFPIKNLAMKLEICVLDLNKLVFSTNATLIYDIYEKGHRIDCIVSPAEVMLIPFFEYGWYDPSKKEYNHWIPVDNYEEGSHTGKCSSPQSATKPFTYTFYVIRNASTHLQFSPAPQLRYKRSGALPKCLWSYDWMNKEAGLTPVLTRIGQTRLSFFDGVMSCESKIPSLQRKIEAEFRIIGLTYVAMKIVPDVSKQLFVLGKPAFYKCSMFPDSAANVIRPDIYWTFDGIDRIHDGAILDVSQLPPGKYNAHCRSRSLTETAEFIFYVISPTAELTVTDINKTTYFPDEEEPSCKWVEPWMNQMPGLAPTSSIVTSEEGKGTGKEILCFFAMDGVLKRSKVVIIVIAREDLELRLTHPFVAYTGSFPTVACEVYPPLHNQPKPVFYTVRPHAHVTVVGNMVVEQKPPNSSNPLNGTYICIFDHLGQYLTKIFVVGYVDMVTTPVVTPAKREFISGESISCSKGHGTTSGYNMLDVFHKGTSLPIVSRRKNEIVVKSAFLTEITIVCTIRETYLTFSLRDEKVTFSALVRPKKLVTLHPENLKTAASTTIMHCVYTASSKMDQQVAVSIFIQPHGYPLRQDNLPFFDFADVGVLGGRYFFTCILSNAQGPLWASIKEVAYLETPDMPRLTKRNIRGEDPVYCWTKEYPTRGRSVTPKTHDENGEIVKSKNGEYHFSQQSLYGIYNVTCHTIGVHRLTVFEYENTFLISYTGNEYALNDGVNTYSNEVVQIFTMFLVAVFCVLILLFFTLATMYREQRIKTYVDEIKYKGCRKSTFREIHGHYVYIDLKELSVADGLRLMTLVCLYDAVYSRIKPRIRQKRPNAKSNWTMQKLRQLIKTRVKDLITLHCLSKDRKRESESDETVFRDEPTY